MTEIETRPTVLVVDDEPAYVDAYTTWLQDRYTVRTATTTRDALQQLDQSIDVALLDRRMPDSSGDEILEEIRARQLDCRVGMVTAVEPEFDIINLPFDEYIVKPVSKTQLRETVESLLTRSNLDEAVQDCFAMASKKVALENTFPPDELEMNEEYRKLVERLVDTETHVDEMIQRLIDDERVGTAYQDITQ